MSSFLLTVTESPRTILCRTISGIVVVLAAGGSILLVTLMCAVGWFEYKTCAIEDVVICERLVDRVLQVSGTFFDRCILVSKSEITGGIPQLFTEVELSASNLRESLDAPTPYWSSLAGVDRGASRPTTDEVGLGFPFVAVQLAVPPEEVGRTAATLHRPRVIWRGLLADLIVSFLAALGAFSIFRAARDCFRSYRNRCVKCGYDLRGSNDNRCPECGHASSASG